MGAYETSIYHAILITGFVLGFVIIYFAFSVFKQQKKYIKMQRQYFTDEINLLEKERTRMARDLHDEVGPLLSLTKSHINEIKTNTGAESFHIEKANENLNRLMGKMEQIALNLTPSSLVKKGLAFTLEKFFSDLQEACSLKFDFVFEVKKDIGPETSIHLYRIVQEITHNTMKHAHAGELRVHFKERGRKLYVFCKDDGTGFDTDKGSEKGQGLGLGSLESRTALLKGKIQCTSTSKYGTEYFFEFPLS